MTEDSIVRAPRLDVVYLKDLVAACLARHGLHGTVDIRPRTPLAMRLETGERARFVVEFHGPVTTRLILDDWEIACGTKGAPVAEALAAKIASSRQVTLAA